MTPIELDSEQQRYQRANESRERAEREHDAAVNKFLGAADGLTSSGFGRKAPETAPSAASELPVTEQDLDAIIAWHADLRALRDYRRAVRVSTMTTTLTPPVVLPDWMQRTLRRRDELRRRA